jgi:hypothetical protein
VIIDNDDVIIVHDNGGIADNRESTGADRMVNTLGHLVKSECSAVMGSARRLALRLAACDCQRYQKGDAPDCDQQSGHGSSSDGF